MPDINQIGHDAESAIVGEMVGCSLDDLTRMASPFEPPSRNLSPISGLGTKDDVELLVFDAVVEAPREPHSVEPH